MSGIARDCALIPYSKTRSPIANGFQLRNGSLAMGSDGFGVPRPAGAFSLGEDGRSGPLEPQEHASR